MSRDPQDPVPYEALSRLAAGELPPDEARALRRRIDTDPDVATAWADLLRLVDALAHLPEERPPAALDAAVLGAAPEQRPGGSSAAPSSCAIPSTRGLARDELHRGDTGTVGRERSATGQPSVRPAVAAGIALALAASAAWILWPAGPDRGEITLVEGVQWVDGAAALVAGDVPVRIDGRARIEVEPARDVVRGPGPEDPMDRKVTIGAAAGGGLAGALLVVAVYEGTATVSLAEGPVVVDAGQTRQFEPAGGIPDPAPADAPLQDQVAALRAENEALREALAEAQFTGAVARGQVAATQGEPVPWPDDVPAGFRPEAFEALLRAEVAKHDGFQVRSLDCSEYPCITTLTTPAGGGWQGEVRQLAEGISGALGEDVGTWMGIAVAETDQGTTGAVGIAFAPGEDLQDDSVGTRLDWRASSMLEEVSDELEAEHPDGHPDPLDVLEDVEALIPRPAPGQNGP